MKYKNISGQDLWIPQIGQVKADGIIETQEPLNNANFELIEDGKKAKAEKPAEDIDQPNE